MRRRALLAAAGVLLAGCTADDSTPTDPSPTSSPSPSPTPVPTARSAVEAVTVTEHDLVHRNDGSDSELAVVTGEVASDRADAVDVDLTATFLDDAGDALDEATVDASLAAGGAWSFEVTFPGSGDEAAAVVGYRLRLVTKE